MLCRCSRTRQKPKIEITLTKSPDFDAITASETERDPPHEAEPSEALGMRTVFRPRRAVSIDENKAKMHSNAASLLQTEHVPSRSNHCAASV